MILKFVTINSQFLYFFVSDEDWNAEPTESSIYLMHGASSPPRNNESLPRIRSSQPTHEPRHEEIRRPQTDYTRKPEYAKQSPPQNRHPNDRNPPEYIVDKRKQPQYFGGDIHYTRNNREVEYQKTLKPEKKNRYYQEEERYYQEKEPSPVQMRRQRQVAEYRQRSPSPKQIIIETSPKDRFKDAKEKFLLLEKQRLEEEERLALLRRNNVQVEKPISPVNNRRSMAQYPRQWNEEDYDDFEERPQKVYPKQR